MTEPNNTTDTNTTDTPAGSSAGHDRQTLGFQTEVKQLLQLMVHSLYSNKEIFLRELISNASDACDKLRYEALTEGALFENDPDLAIDVRFDAGARTITIADNGVGMSRQEVIDNLGTIAKSGTREFLSTLSGDQAKDANLIGQFGVGFYSAFIVADRVTVESRRAGATPAQGVRWMSTGDGEYTLETIDRAARGTGVTLHLREGEVADEFLSAMRLRNVIRKYSDHITLPIRMHKERWDAEASKYVTEAELETVNQASALWSRSKSEITDAQYEEFYKHVAHDFQAPLAWAHAKVEGKQEYTQLLYLPAHAPFDLWDQRAKRGLKLYVRRVFIMDDAEQLLPAYLRFVRGVVDSNDLPLNVSREILQQSRDTDAIRAGCTRRVLSLLEELASDQKEKYSTFWSEFGRVFKEGVGEDHANRERVAKLCRFASTHGEGDEKQTVSLADYVSRMKTGQEKIYYITAETFAAAANSPHLEVFRKKGIEVLLLADRVDEWMVSNLPEFEGKPLASVAKGELDLGTLEDEAEKAEQAKTADEFKPLIERIKQALGERAKDVRVTLRLTDSPACLVVEQGDMGMNLERLLKAAGQSAAGSRPILEINPHHPLVERLAQETDETRFADWSHVLFDQAMLAEGGQLEDPASFVRRLNELMLALAGGAKEPQRIITL